MESYPRGICFKMCPDKEVKRREEEKLLHRLEIEDQTEKISIPKADLQKVIKCFSRSAADTTQSSIENLRPFKILCKTVFHLLSNCVNNTCIPLVARYDFINDRLRAVRQDMVIQALEPKQCIVLLEPMIKFHLTFGYILCNFSISVYDPTLNTKHLMECLKQLLVCYDKTDTCDVNTLISEMKTLQFTDYDIKFGCLDKLDSSKVLQNRSLFEAVYITLNLGDPSPQTRFLSLPHKYRSQLVKDTFHLSLTYTKGFYIKVISIIKTLPPLCLCAAGLQLSNIQRKALAVMSHAYNGKNMTFPKEVLQKLLLYNNLKDLDECCDQYNIIRLEKSVIFNKLTYNSNVKMMAPKKVTFIDQCLAEHTFEDLLLKNCLVWDISNYH